MADEQRTAATKRTIDVERDRVLELLASLQRYLRKGGLDHWDIDGVQAIADLQYAADAVRRFPVGEQLPDAGWRPPTRREFDIVNGPADRQPLDAEQRGVLAFIDGMLQHRREHGGDPLGVRQRLHNAFPFLDTIPEVRHG